MALFAKVHYFFFVVVAALFLGETNGARILGVFPFGGKSHSVMINALLRELSKRGHQLDVITNYPLPSTTANYTPIVISPTYDFWTEVKNELRLPGIFNMHDMSLRTTKQMLKIIGISTTEYALKHPDIHQLIHSDDRHYDLILTEQFYQEAFLMLAYKFRAPIVSVCTYGSALYFNDIFGSFGAWAHVPHELTPYLDAMPFGQRLHNAFTALYDTYLRYYDYLPAQQQLADKYFGHLPAPRPKLVEIEKTISIMLQNTHVPLMAVRPTVPGMVDVGGLHIYPPKLLPDKLKTFLDAAQHGAIYFSFGTQVPCSEMPKEQLSAFIQVFKEFGKQRVLWKWEGDSIPDLPGNILLQKWLPQNDILAHPNVKMFITHGGLFGSQEGVHYGVPMLGIPFYADQHLNTNKAALVGYGVKLDFTNVTVDSLRWALKELLHNPSYAAKAKEVSHIFRDRPERAIDLATYWIEYVIRFKGTPHLSSAGRELSWWSYFLVDIMALVLLVIFMVLFTIQLGIRKCIVGRVNQNNAFKKNK